VEAPDSHLEVDSEGRVGVATSSWASAVEEASVHRQDEPAGTGENLWLLFVVEAAYRKADAALGEAVPGHGAWVVAQLAVALVVPEA
jgi:hypothetical protein